MGGALAIFLAFKNSSAYDRWWEARKIWGGIVNDSRSIGMELNTYGIAKKEDEDNLEQWKKRSVHRHIGWVYALRSHLRKEEFCEELTNWVGKEEIEKLSKVSNIPAQILLLQGKDIAYAFKRGWIEEFRFNALMGTIKKLYDGQGKSERIKNTIFPFYYRNIGLFSGIYALSID